jgi:tRNA G46 methylase TrmB
MAISVAMLGMSTGAVKVYLADFASKTDEEIEILISKYSRLFTLSLIASLLTLLSIPFVPRSTGIGYFTTALIYTVAAVPFYFEGVAVSLILATKYIKQANKLYAADLAGAAIGSLAFFSLLSVTDAVSAIIFISSMGFFSAFAVSKKKSDLVIAICIIIFSVFNYTGRIFKIEWTKVDEGVLQANVEHNIEWESWTPFSRITVAPMMNDIGFGWGISGKMMSQFPDYKVEQKNLTIDSAAATVITKNTMPVSALIHLRYDITNFAHYLFPRSKVGVIGVGGGRDILSALHFDQKEVWGIEINGRIIEALTKVYAGYTYDISALPNVHIIEDEARNFFEKNDMQFDIIQASLIDSWAATASGAFVLTENSLYTLEAWKTFYSRLSDNGAITMSRWYYPKRPGELLRLVNLAYQTLLESGVEDPAKHIILVALDYLPLYQNLEEHFGSGTIVVSKKPFSQDIIDRAVNLADLYGFETLIAGGQEKASIFKDIITPGKREIFMENYSLDLTPPTDDNPFFFNMLKPSAVFAGKNVESEGVLSTNLMAIYNLLWLIAIVIVLSLFLIIIPLISKMKNGVAKAVFNRYTLYFTALGIGFMLIEISLIQKFAVFLGHPTYSILVVLFTMLLFSGLGSFTSKKLREKVGVKGLFILLILVVATVGSANMFVLHYFNSWPILPRIIYSFATMALAGFFMGMPFPTGLSLLNKKVSESAPWFWGVNGAASVVSSVAATAISIFYGISATFFTGLVCYFAAFAAGILIEKAADK